MSVSNQRNVEDLRREFEQLRSAYLQSSKSPLREPWDLLRCNGPVAVSEGKERVGDMRDQGTLAVEKIEVSVQADRDTPPRPVRVAKDEALGGAEGKQQGVAGDIFAFERSPPLYGTVTTTAPSNLKSWEALRTREVNTSPDTVGQQWLKALAPQPLPSVRLQRPAPLETPPTNPETPQPSLLPLQVSDAAPSMMVPPAVVVPALEGPPAAVQSSSAAPQKKPPPRRWFDSLGCCSTPAREVVDHPITHQKQHSPTTVSGRAEAAVEPPSKATPTTPLLRQPIPVPNVSPPPSSKKTKPKKNQKKKDSDTDSSSSDDDDNGAQPTKTEAAATEGKSIGGIWSKVKSIVTTSTSDASASKNVLKKEPEHQVGRLIASQPPAKIARNIQFMTHMIEKRTLKNTDDGADHWPYDFLGVNGEVPPMNDCLKFTQCVVCSTDPSSLQQDDPIFAANENVLGFGLVQAVRHVDNYAGIVSLEFYDLVIAKWNPKKGSDAISIARVLQDPHLTPIQQEILTTLVKHLKNVLSMPTKKGKKKQLLDEYAQALTPHWKEADRKKRGQHFEVFLSIATQV